MASKLTVAREDPCRSRCVRRRALPSPGRRRTSGQLRLHSPGAAGAAPDRPEFWSHRALLRCPGHGRGPRTQVSPDELPHGGCDPVQSARGGVRDPGQGTRHDSGSTPPEGQERTHDPQQLQSDGDAGGSRRVSPHARGRAARSPGPSRSRGSCVRRRPGTPGRISARRRTPAISPTSSITRSRCCFGASTCCENTSRRRPWVATNTARSDLLDLAGKDLLLESKRSRAHVFIAPRDLDLRLDRDGRP